ncbi:MAG: glycoside hydrolase family 3 N-terminal domain-containing protein [Dermatophilaceae bacterium]
MTAAPGSTGQHGNTGRPWLRTDLPLEQRVEALLAEMTLAEKVGQTHQSANLDPITDRELIRRGGIGSSLLASGATAGNERDAGIRVATIDALQRIAVEESRLGIPLLFARDVIHGHRTVFPIPLGLAAAWDEDLVFRTARLAAAEASVDGVAWTFAPMLDISEEPRWGRVAESLGEAPVLAGRLGAAMVRGFQGDSLGGDDNGDGTRGTDSGGGTRVTGTRGAGSIAACAKHFVGYGLVAGGRDYETVQVGENTLRNLYLRPFQAAVQAGCATVMAAFTDVDGVPMHAHRRLLREVLKGEWAFEGVVVADWDGVGQLVNQGVATDLRDAAAQAIAAGVDIDMVSGAYAAHLADLVEAGQVPLDLVDDAARRVIRLKTRQGLFERPYAGATSSATAGATSSATAGATTSALVPGLAPEAPAPVHTDRALGPAARALAREAAAASFVLLTNNGTLPLSPHPGRVLLTGPFAEEGEALFGTWTLDGRGEDVASPAAAIWDRLQDNAIVDDGRFSDRTLHLVRQADITVALVGEHPSRSGEAHSVTDIGLPAGQLEVLRAVAAIGKPLVVVVFTGRPLDLGEVLDLADAALIAWHPGVEAGPALIETLFGDRAPGGRLPMTFPRSVGHLPSSTHARPTGRPIAAADDPVTGRYLDALVSPRLAFGSGLTYTTFSYGPIRLSAHEMPLNGGSIEVSVGVTNSGTRPGREVVQLYLRDVVADVTRPLLELADWVSLELDPGATGTATFTVTPEQLSYYDRTMSLRIDPGEAVVTVGPDASSGAQARITVTQ